MSLTRAELIVLLEEHELEDTYTPDGPGIGYCACGHWDGWGKTSYNEHLADVILRSIAEQG